MSRKRKTRAPKSCAMRGQKRACVVADSKSVIDSDSDNDALVELTDLEERKEEQKKAFCSALTRALDVALSVHKWVEPIDMAVGRRLERIRTELVAFRDFGLAGGPRYRHEFERLMDLARRITIIMEKLTLKAERLDSQIATMAPMCTFDRDPDNNNNNNASNADDDDADLVMGRLEQCLRPEEQGDDSFDGQRQLVEAEQALIAQKKRTDESLDRFESVHVENLSKALNRTNTCLANVVRFLGRSDVCLVTKDADTLREKAREALVCARRAIGHCCMLRDSLATRADEIAEILFRFRILFPKDNITSTPSSPLAMARMMQYHPNIELKDVESGQRVVLKMSGVTDRYKGPFLRVRDNFAVCDHCAGDTVDVRCPGGDAKTLEIHKIDANGRISWKKDRRGTVVSEDDGYSLADASQPLFLWESG